MRGIVEKLGVVLVIAALTSGCASTDASGEYDRNYDFAAAERVAVVAVEGAAGQEAAQNQIAAMFNQSLMRKGYSPVERSQIQAVMDEQEFGQSDVTRASGAAELGRILNVAAVLLVNVPNYGEKMSMSAQMVDTEDASIVWSASGSARTGAGLSGQAGQFLGAVGGGAAGYQADGGRGAVVGGGAGAVGGKIAGEAMTPERQKQAAKLVKEISESLPDRM